MSKLPELILPDPQSTEHASDMDRLWFKQHPGQAERVRPPFPNEWEFPRCYLHPSSRGAASAGAACSDAGSYAAGGSPMTTCNPGVNLYQKEKAACEAARSYMLMKTQNNYITMKAVG